MPIFPAPAVLAPKASIVQEPIDANGIIISITNNNSLIHVPDLPRAGEGSIGGFSADNGFARAGALTGPSGLLSAAGLNNHGEFTNVGPLADTAVLGTPVAHSGVGNIIHGSGLNHADLFPDPFSLPDGGYANANQLSFPNPHTDVSGFAPTGWLDYPDRSTTFDGFAFVNGSANADELHDVNAFNNAGELSNFGNTANVDYSNYDNGNVGTGEDINNDSFISNWLPIGGIPTTDERYNVGEFTSVRAPDSFGRLSNVGGLDSMNGLDFPNGFGSN